MDIDWDKPLWNKSNNTSVKLCTDYHSLLPTGWHCVIATNYYGETKHYMVMPDGQVHDSLSGIELINEQGGKNPPCSLL